MTGTRAVPPVSGGLSRRVLAALVHVLKAPPAAYRNIDVRPLSTIGVAGRAGRWSLRPEGVPAQATRA
ncbi:hypothetical protein ACF1AE_11155 [Streptomyces sp. NPDC014986]|uniref:hypothetical protein n=1 Tax=Streptomyces sp. NPDC014986 TaxID=3364934 RepID=UPI0036F9ACA2